MNEGKMSRMSEVVADSLDAFFADRLEDIVIEGIDEDCEKESFTVEFCLYNYYVLIFKYFNGEIEIGIVSGKDEETLIIIRDKFDKDNLESVWRNLNEEIRLRIPDKYLKKYGWL